MSNIKFSLGIYNKRFNCHGPNNKNQKCPANPSLPKNSILMPNPPNISTKTRHAASIRIQSQGGGRMRLGGIKGGGIPPSTPASTAYTYVWVDRGQGPKNWGGGGYHAIASNATGDRLVALANNQGPNTGRIIRSADYGVTWAENNPTLNTPPTGDIAWRAIASNADGNKIVAVSRAPTGLDPSQNNIWLSSDYGETFAIQTDPAVSIGLSSFWRVVASNDTGAVLVAGTEGGVTYSSTDFGLTWSGPVSIGTDLRCLTCQTVGGGPLDTKFAATKLPGGGGNIWTSTDSGASWTEQTGFFGSPPPGQQWRGIASNGDGTKIVAVVEAGDIWRSIDSGATWVAMNVFATTKPTLGLNWKDIASSNDGTVIVAVPEGGNIWKSTNSGTDWIEDTTVGAVKDWRSVASNASGDRLAAVVFGGNIWTWPLETTTPAFNCAPAPPYPMACIKPPRNTF